MSAGLRLIAHLDMDAFYASVELLRYPELRGKPVVIGGGRRHQPEERSTLRRALPVRHFATLRGYVGRGVATTATYEARALGLHSAMGLMKAAALAPDTILLPVDFDEYRRYSRLFKAAVRTLAPTVEDRGIDEIYLDLTDVSLPRDRRRARTAWTMRGTGRGEVARALKQRVRAATGLSCSIAVAPNKLLAKIASELDKPDGLTMLRARAISRRASGRCRRARSTASVRSPPRGSRRSASAPSASWRAADPAWLIEQFGKSYGAWLHEAAHGRDERPVVTFSEPKSISRETTFERDLHPPCATATQLSRIFTELCEGVSEDLRAQGLRRPHHRPQAPLRQLQDGDARPDDRRSRRRTRGHPPRRGRVPQARAARAAHPPARRARGRTRAGGEGALSAPPVVREPTPSLF